MPGICGLTWFPAFVTGISTKHRTAKKEICKTNLQDTAIIAKGLIQLIRMCKSTLSIESFSNFRKSVKLFCFHSKIKTRTFHHMSRVVRKPAFCICENKDADQLRGNREADQRLCFRYTDCTIPLLPRSKISSF